MRVYAGYAGGASFEVSKRTVGRILAYLERLGRVASVAAFSARARRGKARRKPRRPYAQRKPKGYEAQAPGDLIQVDTFTVTLGPGEMIRHFSAVDLATRFALAEVHTRATADLAAGFLAYLIAQAPFPIRPSRWTGGLSSWPGLKRPARGWASGSSCCLPGAPSSTVTWSAYNGPSGTSSTPGRCRLGFLSSRGSLTLTWTTTIGGGRTGL